MVGGEQFLALLLCLRFSLFLFFSFSKMLSFLRWKYNWGTTSPRIPGGLFSGQGVVARAPLCGCVQCSVNVVRLRSHYLLRSAGNCYLSFEFWTIIVLETNLLLVSDVEKRVFVSATARHWLDRSFDRRSGIGHLWLRFGPTISPYSSASDGLE